MSELQKHKLFKAWAESLARTEPELEPRVRQRVLERFARRRGVAGRWALAGGVALAAVALALLFLLRAPSAPTFQVAGKTGEVGAWLSALPGQPVALQFSEGTRVALGGGSQGRVARVTPGGARLELASGSFSAEVAHLAGAHWSFGAGPFDVTVTGTKLSASWAPERGKFELSVSEGSVLVQGPFIPQPQEVRAGQICRVDLQRRSLELGFLTATPAAPASDSAVAATPSAAPPAPAGSIAAQPSTAVHAPSAEALLEEARAARMAGRSDLERAALLACRKRAPGQPAAAQAAYLLGRASGPGEAVTWFETYLREMPQGLLAREAAGRIIESHQAAGNTSAAQNAASRYLARYPMGPHAVMARQLLDARSEGQK